MGPFKPETLWIGGRNGAEGMGFVGHENELLVLGLFCLR